MSSSIRSPTQRPLNPFGTRRRRRLEVLAVPAGVAHPRYEDSGPAAAVGDRFDAAGAAEEPAMPGRSENRAAVSAQAESVKAADPAPVSPTRASRSVNRPQAAVVSGGVLREETLAITRPRDRHRLQLAARELAQSGSV